MNIAPKEYRDDLQILRAIAVILVFLFHLKISAFEGGYVGVDIFFVLSGYFIAKTLPQKDKMIGMPDTLEFYNRRLRRILPMAWGLFLFVMIVAPFLFLPSELKTIVPDFLASLFLGPNISYWLDNDYFGSLLFRPMLHYWSLGVEYQYYLIFPIVLMIIYKIRYSGIAMLIAGFALSVVMTQISTKLSFFMMPTRFWEFMLGYYAFRIDQSQIVIPTWARRLCLATAAIMIGIAVAFYTPKTVFPGLAAALPAVGAFLFIIGRMGAWPQKLRLAEKVAVSIGTVSFSIYLWHYPVFFLVNYSPLNYNSMPDSVQSIIIVIITVALSYLTYYQVEERFRSKKKCSNRKFYLTMGALFIASLGVAGTYVATGYFQKFYTVQEQKIFSGIHDSNRLRCSKAQRLAEPREKSCTLAKTETAAPHKKIMLAGNSHAASLKPPFIDMAAEYPVDLYVMLENCTPGENGCNVDMFVDEAKKRQITDFVFHALIIDIKVYPLLTEMVDRLTKEGITIHSIDPVPAYSSPIPLMLYYKDHSYKKTLAQHMEEKKDYFAWKSMIAKKYPKVRFYDTTKIFCPDDCKVENDEFIYYIDGHHLTKSAARLATPIVRKIFE